MSRRAKCRCGGTVSFCTDLIGRTVEQCDGCGYEGTVRIVATPKPADPPRKRRVAPKPFDPHRFRCGHPRSAENSAYNKRGWFECRECGRTRAKRSRRAAA